MKFIMLACLMISSFSAFAENSKTLECTVSLYKDFKEVKSQKLSASLVPGVMGQAGQLVGYLNLGSSFDNSIKSIDVDSADDKLSLYISLSDERDYYSSAKDEVALELPISKTEKVAVLCSVEM